MSNLFLKTRPVYYQQKPSTDDQNSFRDNSFQHNLKEFLNSGPARKEDKYILGGDDAEELFGQLIHRIPLSYPKDDTLYTINHTTYFDGPDLVFFKQHFDKELQQKYKFRIRSYAPNGLCNHNDHRLEIKSKQNGISKKNRFYIDNSNFTNLLQQKQIKLSTNLCQLNKNMTHTSLANKINFMNHFFIKYKLVPTVNLQYRRYAFEDSNLRVTIDDNLKFTQLSEFKYHTKSFPDKLLNKAAILKTKYISSYKVIEIKHKDHIPFWLMSFLKERQLKAIGFSKYCYTVSKIISPNTEYVSTHKSYSTQNTTIHNC